MATVQIKVKLIIPNIEILCDGENEEEVIEDIINNKRLDFLMDTIYEDFEVTEGEYDEAEKAE